MVDIHCHILPGLDDGATDLDVSAEMCRMAADDGIEAICCAVHANDRYPFDPDLVQRTIKDVEAITGGRPRLYPACDFHLSYENVQSAMADPHRHTINHGSYLLVEFADLSIPPNIGELFFQFRSRGILPVVTHPERNTWLVHSNAQVVDWVRGGALIQITAGSLFGDFGRHASDFCRWLLQRRLVHFVASDAHNASSRPPLLKKAYELVTEQLGPATADSLFKDNPRCALENRMFEVPPPLELPPRKSFFQRIAKAFSR